MHDKLGNSFMKYFPRNLYIVCISKSHIGYLVKWLHEDTGLYPNEECKILLIGIKELHFHNYFKQKHKSV